MMVQLPGQLPIRIRCNRREPAVAAMVVVYFRQHHTRQKLLTLRRAMRKVLRPAIERQERAIAEAINSPKSLAQ